MNLQEDEERSLCMCGSGGDPCECVCGGYDCGACEGLGITDDCCCEMGQHDPRFCPQGPCPHCGGSGMNAAGRAYVHRRLAFEEEKS